MFDMSAINAKFNAINALYTAWQQRSNLKRNRKSPYIQRGLAWTYESAKEMLDFHFNGDGYIYHFGSYYGVFVK